MLDIAIPTVSVLKMRFPSVIDVAPFSVSSSISFLSMPPSGPIITPIFSIDEAVRVKTREIIGK